MAPGKSGIYFGRMLNLLVSKFRPRIERDFLSNNPQPIGITAFPRSIYFGRACHKTADFVRNQRFSFLKNSGNELLARTSFPGCLTGRGISAPEKMRMGMVSAFFYWNGPAMMPSWAVRPGGPLHRPWPQTGPPSGSLRSGSRTARGPPEAGPDAEWRRNREAGVSAREEGSSPEG